ncbi:EPHX2 [Cervus elaphus hippelaphus]|uniref:EPHX2 n=1 Tax=Cervus elaphus hippelaphus TaxID=46360 RepID=A0A212CMX8_CEREH|nr:EPHX2 [Cervus elaphus hippelaphus]
MEASAENFSIKEIFEKVLSARKINYPMLQAAVTLKKKGFTTCILTNTWLDDRAERGRLAQMLCELKPHFDFLIESCQIGMVKPDPQIYKFVVFLDNFETNLKPAREMGTVTILVHDTDTALKELEKVTGVQLLQTAAPLPISCDPSTVTHGYVPIKPGVRLHFVELGSGPVVCLCHGFPESWFSWRYQIPALAQAGFRVLAVDMKGYGESSAPPEIEEYSLEVLSKDMITFLDKLGISQAVFIGHDWGGMLVWTIALFHPERVRAVASLNTPFMPSNPKVSSMEIIKANPAFNYQLYFQEAAQVKLSSAGPSWVMTLFCMCVCVFGVLMEQQCGGRGFFRSSEMGKRGLSVRLEPLLLSSPAEQLVKPTSGCEHHLLASCLGPDISVY